MFHKRQKNSFMQYIAWTNITVQLLLPLAVSLTPALVKATENKHLLNNRVDITTLQTRPYILNHGETVNSIAQKFHITVEQLQHLNQFRKFSADFSKLKPGDELDVPLTPLPKIEWSPGIKSSAVQEENKQSTRLAKRLTQAGNFLTSNPDRTAATSLARGFATSEVSRNIEQWLNQYGTARVQLNMNDHFSLKNSQLDLLVPLYEQKNALPFIQGSIHRTDNRSQANLGVGLRWFNNDWMLGGNNFWDYDLSRHHSRTGLGLEYWRNFLKLGANSYIRLSNWKNSPDRAGYEERPANGWDIRTEAWIPALPQLGGKLTYEQYYGHDVALFARDTRQNNPHAITAGITYTPVPLLTFTAEHRQGKNHANDTRFSLNMNYQLGVPWLQQINSDAVSAMRSLMGQRYDLVERNNNIVLEYRKKTVIRLETAARITGYSGEQKPLNVSVTSTYPLDHIDWSAPALTAAGGRIVQETAGRYSIILPEYQTDPRGINSFVLNGVAVDKKGNRSSQTNTLIVVKPSEINKNNSEFTPASSTLPADGESAQIFTLTLKDEQQRPYDVPATEIKISSEAKTTSVSSPVRKAPGVYEITVIAGTDAEEFTLTPEISGMTLPAVHISVIKTVPDSEKSAFKIEQKIIIADNETESVLSFTAKDINGRPVTHITDKLAFIVKNSNGTLVADDSVIVSAVKESSTKGTYTATLKGKQPGIYTVSPQYNGAAVGSLSDNVEIKPFVVLKDISANQHTFALNEGFPKTGYSGAAFTLELANGKATDFNWKSDAAWVTVNEEGTVTFSGTGNNNKVTITATPKNGLGHTLSYSFKLKAWFNDFHNGYAEYWATAKNTCATHGYSLPTVAELTKGENMRGVGSLWSEWGDLSHFFADGYHWSADSGADPDTYFAVHLETGKLREAIGGTAYYTCRLPL